MKLFQSLLAGVILTGLSLQTARAVPASQLLQQGLYAEEVEGNLKSAIKTYGDLVSDPAAPAALAAQALYRQGMCYENLKEEPQAKAAFEKLVANYPTQTDMVAKAKAALDDLADFDPASLMPPNTLMYVELGSPGRQVETILTTLKGTPFENPLAAFGHMPAGAANNGPANLITSLLNPSMMAEFKKIRSSAVGVMGLGNNPPMVSVLYPGKSDALRGLIQAGLGMVGAPGEPIEGMQTVTIKNFGAVAFDDRVVIAARPASQLTWCVKQYKGVSSEPSLASSNPLFKKVSKVQRASNLTTVWANIADGYAAMQKNFPDGQIPRQMSVANALVDFENVDDMLYSQTIETNGVSSKFDLQFKDGHHCLAYGLIHTPAISRAGLEAVPAEAIGLASFALSPSNAVQSAAVQSRIQNLTGLDIGREIFANIEQITFFVMPPGASKAPLPGCLGLAITSRDPEQTRRVFNTVLGAITVGKSAEKLPPGKFRIDQNSAEPVYCYVDQVNRTTLLSLNPAVNQAAKTAAEESRSITTHGPLQDAVKQISANTSKLIAVNVGGAVDLLRAMVQTPSLTAEQAKELNASLDQLAAAAQPTTVMIRTEEAPNEFVLSSDITGLPPTAQFLAPVMTVMRLKNEAAAQAHARQLRQEKPAVIMPAAQAPALDGSLDEAWAHARSFPLEHSFYTPIASSSDLAASYRSLWDHDNLYVLVDVVDDVLRHDSTPDKWYDSDSVEIYIDATDAKSQEYGETDFQFAFSWDKISPQIQETKHHRVAGVRFAMVATTNGYRLAACFPWSALGGKPATGARIGLDVQVNDDDTGVRSHKLTWHAAEDNAWETPTAFGNAELGGLVGWWKFDENEGTKAADSSGGKHDGALVGHAKWAPGKLGGAIDLDGQGSYVRIADKSAFDIGGQLTVACWVNFRTVPNEWTGIVTKGDTAWRLSTVEKNNQFHFAVNDFGQFGQDIFINSATLAAPGEWHSVIGVYNGDAMILYIDGKQDADRAWTGSLGRNDADVLIGENDGKPGRSFDGLIDDVRIYNYALAPDDIKALAGGREGGSR
ncbi:MAG TPA: sugar-binding protein [Verrucomicrobiae bacterium]|jgi:hypothetical protein|nr:sugar-binding protein [Verrucomicrobiae bacterium]